MTSSNWQPTTQLSSSQAAGQPDLSLISELYETIERSPPGIEARKLLLDHYISCGWLDAAQEIASQLLSLNPNDSDTKLLQKTLSSMTMGEVCGVQKSPRRKTALSPSKVEGKGKNKSREYASPSAEIKDINEGRSQLSEGYKALFSKAKMVHWEMEILRDLFYSNNRVGRSGVEFEKTFEKNNVVVGALAEGRLGNSQRARSKPGTARNVAREMQKNPAKALDIAFQDLTNTADWLRSAKEQTKTAEMKDDDTIREALVKRTKTLMSALPPQLQAVVENAQMHFEHEILKRTYVCSETMYGDPVSEIPRERFWVSEDGYPWDMEELAQAITSNGGVMRNPLSRQLFTPSDVKAIVKHPLGKALAALQLAQDKLYKGVRPQTIDQLAHMSSILLKDNSEDQMESRHVIDEFLAYAATLPEAEQKALDGLRVPATDSFTKQPFDSTIGEAVRDAQGNRVCIHKIGDFLGQAAQHLRQKH